MIFVVLLSLLGLCASQALIDLGACGNPPCFRIKNQCNFTTHAFGLGGCCTAFSASNPSVAIPSDGRVHEFPMGCTSHGRIAFGTSDPNSVNWYDKAQIYSLLEPGPSAGCSSINYDTSYIDTGFLMPMAARAFPCNTQAYCATSYHDAISSVPASWVRNSAGQSYVLSFSRVCDANPNDPDCVAIRASAKKLSQAVGECADSAVDSRPISQITGCGGGPWSASSSCCAAVNFGLVDYILRTNNWHDWSLNANCTKFFDNKYTSAYNLYQKWIETACHVKYQYGFPYADHCGWSSDLNCANSKRMDVLICPYN